MVNYLIVFIGGGIGAALRHGVNQALLAWFGAGFSYGTLSVNVVGGLLMGVLAELFLIKSGTQEWELFLTTGLLGGFTTFSAFTLDAAVMWQRGDHLMCTAYVVGSVFLSLGALLAGMAAARAAF